MDSLRKKPNVLFLIAVRSYKLSKHLSILTPKLQTATRINNLKSIWFPSWHELRAFETEYKCTLEEIIARESEWEITIPDDLKKYLTTISDGILDETFFLGSPLELQLMGICEIPPNTSHFKKYECPYGFNCRNCAWKRSIILDDPYYMADFDNDDPECDDNVTRGMLQIGPTQNGRQDWIVLKSSNLVNLGTIWEQNTKGELFYIADSFTDYIMSILRKQIIRNPNPLLAYMRPTYVDNVGHQIINQIRIDVDTANMEAEFNKSMADFYNAYPAKRA